MTTPSDYALLDSGEGEKLERLGPVTLARPCSVALWRRRCPAAWSGAARYAPKTHWLGAPTEPWKMQLGSVHCLVRCQNNGQIGVFPEHLSYFPWLSLVTKSVTEMKARPARVLNLFAYTGLASILCALQGAEVTHIDNSKAVLSWARENAAMNRIPAEKLRLLCDDALAFIEREARRGNRYDVIIADPPSFSRPTKGKSWDLEEVVGPLLKSMTALFESTGSALVLSSHHQALTATVLQNLLFDFVAADTKTIPLALKESSGIRTIPSGTALCALTEGLQGIGLP
ncbi:MAG: class I SAM-dependent methyltransferase [Bdellovibrionota bacterium]|nr:MAG: class I SAM-dependent methyltransferase [Bdellovibrionota bacterium]